MGQNNGSLGICQPPGYVCGLLQWRPHAGGSFNLRCHLSLSHHPLGSARFLACRGRVNLQMHSRQTLAPASSGHPPASASLAGRKTRSPAGQSSGHSPSMLEVLLCSMGLNRSQVSLSYTLYQPSSQPGVNSDSSHGQHRKVTTSVDTGHSTELLCRLSNFVLTFTQHPLCTSLASLKSQVFEMQASHVVQAGVVAPSGLKLWL